MKRNLTKISGKRSVSVASRPSRMSIFLKKLAMSLIGLLCCVAGFSLGIEGVDRGYVVVGKHVATTYYRASNPTQFYLAICVMFAFGIGGLFVAAFSLLATGKAEAEIVAQIDSALHVRKSIRRLGLIVGVLFLVLLALVSLR